MWSYLIIAVILLVAELVYFRIADHYNIVDKPNERSSHSRIVLRGGGIIFTISILIWLMWQMVHGEWSIVQEYIPFIIGLVFVAGISFWDDVQSLPDSLRMLVQIVACLLMFWNIGIMQWSMWWVIPIALFFCVGATNIINFMDGINGITAGYGLAMLIPILLLNINMEFIEQSYLIVAIIGLFVFCIFNMRPKGKAKCFAGDVGSIAIAFIILFALGKLMFTTGDITYIVFFLLYGVDGILTFSHRIMLHENLGQAHRKHAFQLMSNELEMGHITVTMIYTIGQLVVSLGFIYLCPDTVLAHWIYFVVAAIVLAAGYILFMHKFYYLHEEYLASLGKRK